MNWSRKELKTNAKVNLKKNYVATIIVCFLIAIVASGYIDSGIPFKIQVDNKSIFRTPTVSEEIQRTLENIAKETQSNIEGLEKELNITHDSNGMQVDFNNEFDIETKGQEIVNEIENKFKLKNATEGILATLVNNATNSSSFLVGVLNTINKFIFGDQLLESVIMATASVIIFLFWILIQNILLVGECRFFLENKNYKETQPSRILFVYKVRRTWNVAKIMLLRYLFNILWYFTIVGGFVKIYEYSMIPFILAENPDIKSRDAFSLSKEMMKGNKWATFKLDLSFMLWWILSSLTLGIVGFLYVHPFLRGTKAELYFTLRKNTIEKGLELSKYFNDCYLTAPPADSNGKYPSELFSIKERYKKDWTSIGYNRNYALSSLVIIFFSVSFIGWVWEVFLTLLKTGDFVNRGTMVGPWLPIYGFGSVLTLLLLKRWIKNPVKYFVGIICVAGVMEYFTSWALEKLFDAKWWDYSNMFGNINGRICLEGLLFFAVGGSLIAYFVAPLIDEASSFIPEKTKRSASIVLITIFVIDGLYSIKHPNKGAGITDNEGASPITSSISADSNK